MGQLIKVESAVSTPETRQYLTFTLAGEHFAVGTLSVKEIIEYGQLTGVPMMPPHIRGGDRPRRAFRRTAYLHRSALCRYGI